MTLPLPDFIAKAEARGISADHARALAGDLGIAGAKGEVPTEPGWYWVSLATNGMRTVVEIRLGPDGTTWVDLSGVAGKHKHSEFHSWSPKLVDPGHRPAPEQPAKERFVTAMESGSMDVTSPAPPAAGTEGKTRGGTWAEKNVAMGLDGDLSVCGYCTADRVRDELAAAIDAAAAEAREKGEGEIVRLNLRVEELEGEIADLAAARKPGTEGLGEAKSVEGFTSPVKGSAVVSAPSAAIRVERIELTDEAKRNLSTEADARKPGNAGEIRRLADELYEVSRNFPSASAMKFGCAYAKLCRAIDHDSAPVAGETADAYAERAVSETISGGGMEGPVLMVHGGVKVVTDHVKFDRPKDFIRSLAAAAFAAGSISRPAAAKPDAVGLAERIVDGLHDAKLAVYSSSFDVTREYLIATIRSILAVPERKGP